MKGLAATLDIDAQIQLHQHHENAQFPVWPSDRIQMDSNPRIESDGMDLQYARIRHLYIFVINE